MSLRRHRRPRLHLAADGATSTSTFDYHWSITGVVVAALIGSSCDTFADNRNILHFLLPPARSFAQNSGSHRAVSGVNRPNLTYTGLTTLPELQTRLDHRGVICLQAPF